jgi:hypothetical protein
MFKLLLDTNVWLDVAKDERQAPLLTVINQMVERKLVTLLVPLTVRDEFRRNRARIAKESARSLSTHFRIVRDAVGRIGGDKRKLNAVLDHLNNVNQKLPLVAGAAEAMCDFVENLMAGAQLIEASEKVKLLAAQRAIDKKAPFHRDRNSMADALIIETYAEQVRKSESGMRFAFVTHNKHDFSAEGGNQKLPHADIDSCFSRIKSLYFINLPQALRRIEPSLVTDAMLEQSWEMEPRGLTEILSAENFLFDQVWYSRHCALRTSIEEGRNILVDEDIQPGPAGAARSIRRDIWKGALKAAARVERDRGTEHLGPWTDFEWGMINGKLSALRWVLGDEWDMLDT